MLKTYAIKRLGGTQAATARELKISRQAVCKWPMTLHEDVANRVRRRLEEKAAQAMKGGPAA